MVFSIPKRLRVYFGYDRQRNSLLFDAAWHAVKQTFKAADPAGVPGAVMAIHTAGSFVNFHPHLHAVVSAGVTAADGGFRPATIQAADVQQRFQDRLLQLLHEHQLLDSAVIKDMRNWPHSGFSVWFGPPIDHDPVKKTRQPQ